MLNSKQVIEITGISRATLNNYVSLGILPNPVIRTPSELEGRATRLGYFEDAAVDRILQVQKLKKQGLSMAQISQELSMPLERSAMTEPAAKPDTGSRVTSGGSSGERHLASSSSGNQLEKPGNLSTALSMQNLSFGENLEALSGPAYMVNNKFELTWCNGKANRFLSNQANGASGKLHSRSLLRLLFSTESASDPARLREMLRPHMVAAKTRLGQSALFSLYTGLTSDQLEVLKDVVEQSEGASNEAVIRYPTLLSSDLGQLVPHDLHICFFREGTLFAYSPVEQSNDYLLEFLKYRDPAINEILAKGNPYFTEVAVLVAEVQDSKKLCTELPPEEYFELINTIRQNAESIFQKYHGVHGKHVSSGLLYYFLPQPEAEQRLQTIQCSLDLREMMQAITRQWQARRNWFTDVYLNIGLSEGQEWLGNYHAGSELEFTTLGETTTQASRISEFACDGAIWATKNLLSQLPHITRNAMKFGISKKTALDESIFVANSYAALGDLIEGPDKIHDEIARLPITEVRALS